MKKGGGRKSREKRRQRKERGENYEDKKEGRRKKKVMISFTDISLPGFMNLSGANRSGAVHIEASFRAMCHEAITFVCKERRRIVTGKMDEKERERRVERAEESDQRRKND